MKTIISYLLILTLITLFTLFLDAVSGLFVLIIFAAAIVISTVLHLYAVKLFNCELAINAALVEKNETILLTIRTPKTPFFLPTVFELTFNLSYHLECPDSTYSVTLSQQEKTHTLPLKSKFWGKSAISIAEIKSIDILGIFTPFFRRYLTSKSNQTLTVKIFPSIPDLSKNSELLRTLEDASAYDDNEQSREVPFAITGFPGYEHRDYVPGDSLKSINWKLSAKRDRLLTRKPEAYAGGDMILILNCRKSVVSPSVAARINEQLALEAMLALANLLTKQEILCRAYIRYENSWEIYTLQSINDIEKLRYELTDYQYRSKSEDFDILGEKASGIVEFTAEPAAIMLESDSYSESEKWQINESDNEIIFTRG
jgi:uncharacterized protein (DUF58 family)